MEYVLTTRGLSKTYGSCHALRNLSMEVPKGAIYGLVGRNGAGKTTLIRLLCGLQTPTAGSYTLYGVDYTNQAIHAVRRRLGAVVESPAIYQDLSAINNLKMQAQVLGLPSQEELPHLLELVGLEDTGRKKVRHFSLGMRQRLGIAMALVGSPDVLVLDEPVNGLDPQGIVEMRELLLRLNRENQITILLSSHILDELARLATHYGFLDRGQMVQQITAGEVEAACRKCTHVEVSDVAALARVLDGMGLDYTILSSHSADIYAHPHVTELVQALADAGCQMSTMHQHDESLESYYMSLVGGDARG